MVQNKIKTAVSTKFILQICIDVFIVTVGSAIAAVSLQFFLIPGTIAPGGVSGLSVAIEKLTGIRVYIMNLVINIPLFILGAKLLGKKICDFNFIFYFNSFGNVSCITSRFCFYGRFVFSGTFRRYSFRYRFGYGI